MITQNKMRIRVRKRAVPQLLTLYILFAPFFLNLLQQFLHFPSFVKYTIDVAWLFALLFMVFVKIQVMHKKIAPFILYIVCFILYATVLYLFNYQSIFYFLWGVRNNVRFYIAFMAYIVFLDKEDIDCCLKFVDVIFVVHAITVFIQFFFLNYKWDYLGGIFGTEVGCNAHSLILITIVSIKSLLMFLNNNEKIVFCLLKCAISLVIAAMSELKFFFVVFIVIMIMAFFITKTSWKKIAMALIGVVFIIVSGTVFTQIWGQHSALTYERILELIMSENYSSARDLGRFTAIPTISDTIMDNNWQRFFGLGLGNCDTSSFAICNTPFFETYKYLNYIWFSSAMVFLEIGIVGLILIFSFFVMCFIFSLQLMKKRENIVLSQMSMIMSVICIMLVFYNSSLRTDISYVAYFVLALPFINVSNEEPQLLK